MVHAGFCVVNAFVLRPDKPGISTAKSAADLAVQCRLGCTMLFSTHISDRSTSS